MEKFSPTTFMNPQEKAQARANAYALLSDLLLNGVTNENWSTVQQIESLAKALPKSIDKDQSGASHYELFGLNLFPYESAFLGDDGMLGGEVSESVTHLNQALGVPLETAVSEPDHIGWELYALAFLCGAEADAWEDQLPGTSSIELSQIMQHHSTSSTSSINASG